MPRRKQTIPPPPLHNFVVTINGEGCAFQDSFDSLETAATLLAKIPELALQTYAARDLPKQIHKTSMPARGWLMMF
jgi:hypothetical protein